MGRAEGAARCAGVDDADRPCAQAPADGAPVALCEEHLRAAADWVTRDSGVLDVLPGPCAACGSSLGVHWPSGWVCAVCEWRWGDIPDPSDRATEPIRVDVVYYLRHGDRLKIGTTFTPRTRFQALLFDEVMAFERGDRLVERRRHEQFADLRLGSGEWFAFVGALREHVADLAAGVDDPWALYARWRSAALARAR